MVCVYIYILESDVTSLQRDSHDSCVHSNMRKVKQIKNKLVKK